MQKSDRDISQWDARLKEQLERSFHNYHKRRIDLSVVRDNKQFDWTGEILIVEKASSSRAITTVRLMFDDADPLVLEKDVEIRSIFNRLFVTNEALANEWLDVIVGINFEYKKKISGGVRTATLIVAANDASAQSKASADYVCDGIADQNEINAAYDWLEANLEYIGGMIQLTEGNFYISDKILFDGHTPASLHGIGFQSYWPVAGFEPAGTVIHLVDNSNKGMMEFAGIAPNNGWSCGSLWGIWFDGNKANNAAPTDTYAIDLSNRGDINIDHCMFCNCAHSCVMHLNNHGSWLKNCDFEDNNGRVLYIDKTRNWITNNHFARNGVNDALDNTINIGASYQWILDNNFDDHGSKNINSGGSIRDIFIKGNYFADWANNSAECAIRLRSGDSDWVITDNIFNGSPSGDYGVYSIDDHSRLQVHNNIFRNIPTPAQAIVLTGVLTDCEIHENSGWRTENAGAALNVNDGGTINHGLIATPTRVNANPTVSGEFVSVTAIGAANFTVAIKKHDGTAGTQQTIYWNAARIL